MLVVDNVCKRFGNVIALDGIRLSIGRGELIGFLGPNGAGKSTTMRAIMGLISTDAGSITWDGEPITATTRRNFGYMPAERGMYPKMTVREQVVYFARLAGLSAADASRAATTWMQRVDVEHRADDEVQALSSGNQQRVQLAIALVNEPELLILDEPFSGLDPVAVENMKSILLALVTRGTAVLFSSHQLDLVSDISGDVAIIDAGRIVLEGNVRDIRERTDFRYAQIRFAEPTSWAPSVPHAEIVAREGRSVRLKVPALSAPAALLDDASRAGRVVEFSFVPPDLSEVFLAAVGRDAFVVEETVPIT